MNIYGPRGIYELVGLAKPFLTSLHHIKCTSYKEDVPPQSLPAQLEHSFFSDPHVKIKTVTAHSGDPVFPSPVTSFFLVPAQSRGKFLPEKAVKFGAKPNQHFKLLNEGVSVTLPNGDVIHPSSVTLPSLPQECVGLFYVPSLDHLPSFLSNASAQLSAFFACNLDS